MRNQVCGINGAWNTTPNSILSRVLDRRLVDSEVINWMIVISPDAQHRRYIETRLSFARSFAERTAEYGDFQLSSRDLHDTERSSRSSLDTSESSPSVFEFRFLKVKPAIFVSSMTLFICCRALKTVSAFDNKSSTCISLLEIFNR